MVGDGDGKVTKIEKKEGIRRKREEDGEEIRRAGVMVWYYGTIPA